MSRAYTPRRSDLEGIARRAMLTRGLLPDFSHAALAEMRALTLSLEDLFVRLNDVAEDIVETQCPSCGTRFPIDLTQTAAA